MKATTFANIKWNAERLTNGTWYAYAWPTDGHMGDVLARGEGKTKQDAYSSLHANICQLNRIRRDHLLVAADGAKLTSDGAMHWQTNEWIVG